MANAACDTGKVFMGHADQIQQLLAQKPGLKAQEISGELGIEREEVVTLLHGLQGEVFQDNAYRWWPKARGPLGTNPAPAPRSLLGKLCRYYLECLSRESGSGISLSAADTAGYVELHE